MLIPLTTLVHPYIDFSDEAFPCKINPGTISVLPAYASTTPAKIISVPLKASAPPNVNVRVASAVKLLVAYIQTSSVYVDDVGMIWHGVPVDASDDTVNTILDP